MMAMSSTSSFSSHQSNINLPLIPSSSSSSNWPLLLDDPNFITLLPNLNLDQPPTLFPAAAEQVGDGTTTTTTVKKMNHNASERQRRKKMNALYSSLRSLLPSSDHHPMKKLSIPTTVSRVVKYIPELQQQVETLTLRKKQLLSTSLAHIPKPEDVQTLGQQDKQNITNLQTRGSSSTNFSPSSSLSSSSSTVSVSWVSDDEVMVQVSIGTTNNMVHVSDLLFHLEEECGLFVMNTSSFRSPQGMTFYNLHLYVEECRRGLVLLLNSEVLSERLTSFLKQGRRLVCF